MKSMIRAATLNDAEAMTRLHVAAWRETYAELVPKSYLEALDATIRVEQRRALLLRRDIVSAVVERNGSIAGFALGGPCRSSDPSCPRELYAIYLLRAFQRRGCGLALVRFVATRFVEQGCDRFIVWVLRDNHSARRFYEQLGGTLIREMSIDIGGAQLVEVAYGLSARALVASTPADAG